MQFLPNPVSLIIGSIALYFALLWGFEASRILTSPIYGLDNSAFAHGIYGLGRVLDLSPNELLLIAAFFGVVKLAVACLFICHIVDRMGALWGRKADHESLEAALVLAVVSTLVAATPALIAGASGMLRLHTLHLVLAGVVATLSVVERIAEREENTRVTEVEKAAVQAAFETTVTLPALRNAVSAWRWNLLRKAASSAAAGREAAKGLCPLAFFFCLLKKLVGGKGATETARLFLFRGATFSSSRTGAIWFWPRRSPRRLP